MWLSLIQNRNNNNTREYQTFSLNSKTQTLVLTD